MQAVIKRLICEVDVNSPVKKRQKLIDANDELVTNFFKRDDISRMSACTKDVITIESVNKKIRLQKRILYMSLKETYTTFKDENPNIKIGFSKFCSMRPLDVLLSSQTPANVCVFIHHENIRLSLDTLSMHTDNIPKYSTEFPSSCLCNPPKEECWFNTCKNTSCGFQQSYKLQKDGKKDVKWYKWSNTDGWFQKFE